MRKSDSRTTRRRLARAGLAAGAAATVLAAATSTPAFAAGATLILSASAGATATTPTITMAATTAYLSGVTTPIVTFSIPACVTTYTSAASTVVAGITATAGNIVTPSASVRKLTNSKLVATVPATVALASPAPTTGITKFNVCVYASATAGSAQIGQGVYSVAAPAAITAVGPTGGPSVGGSLVTVSGTGLPTTAAGFLGLSIGGVTVPAASITPVSANSFTFIAPAHSPTQNALLELTTAAGPVRFEGAFDYTNALVVAPNTAPNESITDIDILGANFLATDFIGGFDDANGHVYLVDGAYDPSDDSGEKTAGAVAECLNVFVIDDGELICTLNLRQSLDLNGNLADADARTVAATVAGTALTAPTGNFTAADIGLRVAQGSNTNVAAASYITAIVSPTVATLNQAATLDTATPFNVDVGGSTNVRAVASTASNGASLLTGGTATAFTTADIGRPVAGTNVAPGTTITGIGSASGNATATLSRAVTGSVTTVNVTASTPVPDGTYTVTVVNNGAIDANTDFEDTYTQSLVSSGSTFTVADY